jgi:probable nitrogen fixation protein
MNTVTAPTSETLTLPDSLFIKELVKQWRAQDTHGVWEKKSDAELIAPYIVTKEQRRNIPMIADPDARTLHRIELFYHAVGMAIEQRTGTTAMPIIKMHHEGFGRIILIAGRLVVVSRVMRDAHRFGFETLEKLVAEGEKLVDAGAEMIKEFPAVVEYGN